jgi:hypothetical protein
VRVQVRQMRKAEVERTRLHLSPAAKQTQDPLDGRNDEGATARTLSMMSARAAAERQRMEMEMAENNQERLNKGTSSRDAAEALALSRAYRREAQVTIEAQEECTRRTAEEVQSHWATFRVAQQAQLDTMRMLKEQLQMFQRPAAPPPSTDYTPAIVEGLKTLRDFGVALVQVKSGVLFGPPAEAPKSQPDQDSQPGSGQAR